MFKIKIISDDKYIERRSNSPRIREFGIVWEVGVNTTTLISSLIYTSQLVNNVRLAKLKNMPVTV